MLSSYYLIPHLNNAWLLLITFITISISSLLSISIKNNCQNNIEEMEFENYILSTAVENGTRFCAVLNQNGTLRYKDKKFKKYFQQSPCQVNINDFFKTGDITGQDKELFNNALEKNEYLEKNTTFNINNKIIKFKLELIPIETKYKENEKNIFLLKAYPPDKEELYKNLLSKHNIPFFISDDSDNITYANGILHKLVNSENVEGLYIKTLIPKYSYNNEKYEVELTNIEEKKILTELSTIHDSISGISYNIISSINSLTPEEHKENLKIIDMWNKAFENSVIGITLINKEGEIKKYNQSFQKITRDTNQSNILDIVNKDFKEELLFNLNTCEIFNIELKLMNDENVMLYFTPVNSSDIYYLVYLINTNDKKNLEVQFAQSQKMQAIGQLAGGIAHDFNNLLTAILGFCDLLLMRHMVGDPSFSDIMQVKQNANRAVNLVRQLLAFSRQQTLQPQVINFTDVISELSDLIRRLIGENIKLNIQYSGDLWNIKVDKGQLEQVLINIIINARDAMYNTGILIIKTQNISEKNIPSGRKVMSPENTNIAMGEYVLISIIDNGCGIEPEKIDKIFNPFFSTKESGTGLGLSTVYGIVKQSGGHIFVDSIIDNGTTFHILFPKSFEKMTLTNDDPEMSSQDLTGNNTVLLVEDETAVRMCSTSALTNKGYKVIATESSEEAIDIFNNPEKYGKIDLLITDIVMPNKKRHRGCRRITRKRSLSKSNINIWLWRKIIH